MEEVTITPEIKPDGNLEQIKSGGEITPPETLFAGKYKTIDETKKGIAELITKGMSDDDIVSKYKELESGIGAPKKAEPPPEQKPKEGEQTPPLKIEEKPVTPPEGAFQKYFDEFAQTGVMSDDSYKELEAKGLSRAVVDSYIAGYNLQKTQFEQKIFDSVGGKENYSTMIGWAKDNLNKAEIDAFNTALEATPELAALAVGGLYAKFSAANKSPKLVMGGGEANATSGDVYESIAQMTRDMSTDLYKKDPAEQKRVREKLGRSKIL